MNEYEIASFELEFSFPFSKLWFLLVLFSFELLLDRLIIILCIACYINRWRLKQEGIQIRI